MSARLGAQLPRAQAPAARPSRGSSPHLFIFLNKNINRVRRATKGGGWGEAELDRCEQHLSAVFIRHKMAPLWSFLFPSPSLPSPLRHGWAHPLPTRPAPFSLLRPRGDRQSRP